MRPEDRASLDKILARVRTDNHAMKGPAGALCLKEPLTDTMVEAHLAGGVPRGVYLIKPGESTCRAAVFDLDSHKGATSWEEMTAVAWRLFGVCEALGLKPHALRSTGGKGVHLWMLWADPQDAYSVRQRMTLALTEVGMADGAKGVSHGEVEVLPKQDSVDVGRWGSMVVLPFAGASEALDPDFDLTLAMPRDELVWRASDPVPVVEKPVREAIAPVVTADLAKLQSALDAIPNDTSPLDYDEWRNVMAGIHHETAGTGEDIARAFSMRAPHYEDAQFDKIWDEWLERKSASDKPTTAGTIYHLAAQHGWEDPDRAPAKAEDFSLVVAPAGEEPSEPARVLDPKDQMGLARALMRAKFHREGRASLLRASDLWYEHAGPCWVEVPDSDVKAEMWNFLDTAKKAGKEGVIEPFKPVVAVVGGAVDALRAVAGIRGVVAPCWLPGYAGPAPGELVSLADGLLHIPTRTLLPHSAGFFSLNTLPFAWGEGEQSPTEWLKFLEAVWPGDPEAQLALQEMFGYLLTADTSQQKMFLLRGPKRSGKGTIARVLGALLGRENIVSPTLTSLTSNFGLQPLIGKLVALIPDARVGGQTNTQAVVEKLLMVSGEDSVTVDRKNKDAWTGTLAARVVIMTNEMPRLGDASGALAGRFILISMRQSFYGKEDLGLTSRLLREMPGIFRWALEGRDRLKARGYFVQPSSAQDDADDLADANSAISVFVEETMEHGAEFTVSRDDAYEAWRTWCGQNGRTHIGTKQSFGGQLRDAFPNVGDWRPRAEDGARVREFTSIRIKPHVRSQMGLFSQ